MRKLLVIGLMLTFVGSAMAIDLGNERPAKPEINWPENIPNPERQGGDTILSAVPIVIPPLPGQVALNGTTSGYVNDYDAVCPYSGSTAPDVVYTFTPSMNMAITVEMYGAAYDTKIYIWDQNLSLVACNDDFYSDYTSRLEDIPVTGGEQYFLVIDGYGGDAGVYTGLFEKFVPCDLEWPADAALEGEPPIVDGYVDDWNGGCNTPPEYPFQTITSPIFGGKSGYYLSSTGQSSRDTDWFQISIPDGGVLEIIIDAEEPTYLVDLGVHDCAQPVSTQIEPCGPCAIATMTVVGPAGYVPWIIVFPQTFWDGATYEFDYVLWLNLQVAVEPHSWTAVKRLFN